MKKVVVKVGSSIIAPQGKIQPQLIAALVQDILEAQKQGCQIILVSSGAIASGADCLNLARKPTDVHSLMALASLGQIVLMEAYSKAFQRHGRFCGQILLSWDDFDSRKRFLNARQTIDKLLALGIVPIINENDAVSDEEIKFGDNDRLSALTADLAGAGQLIILSDVEGLLDERKQVIPRVEKIDDKVYGLVRKKAGAFTSGGMSTKLEAARICTHAGITMVIAKGKERGVVPRIIVGESIGTLFLPKAKIDSAKKRWIAFSKKAKGRLYIDDGARDAILERGKSLLCVGIIKVEGEFKKKDSVQVLDQDGNLVGAGLVNYSAQELISCGRAKLAKEVIHRDSFAKYSL